jgi:hypothetical protein
MSSFNWKSLVGSVAPTIATALGGPLAGMAVKTVGDALGLATATDDTVSAALQNATPDQLAAIKKADQDFAAKMKELDIKLDELDTQDRASARAMMIQTKAKTPAVLSYFVVILITAIYCYLIMGDYSQLTVSDLVLGRILGTLDTAFAVVLAYWLGAAHREPFQQQKGTK